MGFIQPIPVSYIEKIRAVPGVKLVTHASWFGGIYQDPSTNVFQFAVDPETVHGRCTRSSSCRRIR